MVEWGEAHRNVYSTSRSIVRRDVTLSLLHSTFSRLMMPMASLVLLKSHPSVVMRWLTGSEPTSSEAGEKVGRGLFSRPGVVSGLQGGAGKAEPTRARRPVGAAGGESADEVSVGATGVSLLRITGLG